MIEVKIQSPQQFDRAIRLFKKVCQKDGFMIELKERRFYNKPSERRRIKSKKKKR